MPTVRRVLCHVVLLLSACADQAPLNRPRERATDDELDAAAAMSMTTVDAGAAAAPDAGRSVSPPGESSTMTGRGPGAGGSVAPPIDAGVAADSGSDAAAERDPCEPSPCQHGGLCSAGECDCTGTGYAGTRCQTEIDECASAPCLNGGVCIDQLRSYRCMCPSGWQGLRCETSSGCTAKDKAPCQSGSYCAFDIGDACGVDGQRGTCTKFPAACLQVEMPVCGCDGMSYENECRAAMRGVSVERQGNCKTDQPTPKP